MRYSRRDILALAAALSCQSRAAVESSPFFEIVPPRRSGITWTHNNARSAEHWLPESMCSGCAFLDYDNDGWMDIFLVNTGPSEFFHPGEPLPRSALYRNNRDCTFTDVTAKAGLDSSRFGEGVAVGDYDGDGYPDIYLTCYGTNVLYQNNGDGTFTDVTRRAGVGASGWSTSAVWFDYDNDGKLDLFVCNFIDYSTRATVVCGSQTDQQRSYCIPKPFDGRASLLYHNNGDGTFAEVGHLTAIGAKKGKAHGVVATDINRDGLLDLWVANDTVANFLFLNRGGGKFDEAALQAGLAYADNGQARSGMGVDAADFDNDGNEDLFVGNIDRERFCLYHNDGEVTFTDYAESSGIGKATHFLSGWGLKFFDYDNGGNTDLLLANGHPDDRIDETSTNVTWAEPLLLFRNDGKRWTNVSSLAGPAFQMRWPARGLAAGDFDNDGAVDILITNNGAAPLLLRNRSAAENNWLGLKLVGTSCNRDATGARVNWSFGGSRRSRLKNAGGSYLSSHDPRMVLGIGPSKKVDLLEIHWPLPSRRTDRFTSLPVNRYITIVEGQGITA